MLKIIAGCLLAAAIGAAFIQKKSITKLRQQNDELRQRSNNENRGSAPLPVDNAEIESLAEATKDLPKLRNEVRQLREQKSEMERLRQDKERVRMSIASRTNISRLADMPGYVAREHWAQAGFATPEATVQSFFWAIANQDLGSITQCMSPQMKEQFERQFAGKSLEEQQKALAAGFEAFGRMRGYRIAETRGSDQRVTIGIQAGASGAMMRLPLERIGDEWKLNELKRMSFGE